MVEVQPENQNTWPATKNVCECKCTQSAGAKKLRYVQPPRIPSYAPVKVYKPPEVQMSDNSTYKLSYEAFDQKLLRSCRGTPLISKENLVPSGEFSAFTTHKMSYGSWVGIQRQKMIYPQDHNLNGEGPISSMTTARHDFQAKKVSTGTKFLPKPNLGFSTAKMDGNTTNILSYQCPDYRTYEAPISYKPQTRYLPPSTPLDGNTTQKLSFLPWEPKPKEELPWARQCPYVTPQVPLDGNTIYNGSFLAPGTVVEDADGHCEDCKNLYPGECGKRPDSCEVDR